MIDSIGMYLHEKLPETSPFESNDGDSPQHHYALMCHKNEADRIRDAMLRLNDTWNNISYKCKSDCVCPSLVQRSDGISIRQRCIVVPLPEEKGRRKDRQGYSLMVIIGGVISPADLMHMARKQISWAGKLSHRTQLDNSNSGFEESRGIQHSMISSVGAEIWTYLDRVGRFDIDNDLLRLDVYPKSHNHEVCKALQRAAAGSTTSNSANESGISHEDELINLTHSAPKARCVVSIVVLSDCVYWGVSTNKQHWDELNQTMNDNATREILLETTDSITGLDVAKQAVSPEIPVSRAYYKLAQVFEDRDNLDMISQIHEQSKEISVEKLLSHGSGLDIGASPGGWTQVMHHTLKLPVITCVDPGVLAQRVSSLPGVHHIRNDISSEETIKFLASVAPFSLIVCDACVDLTVLFDKIVETFEGVSSLVKSPCQLFAWPLCLVLTLKFPYKTSGSIDRHMDRAKLITSEFLRKIMKLGCDDENQVQDVKVHYKICHLFANSVAERCLVAVFDKDKK